MAETAVSQLPQILNESADAQRCFARPLAGATGACSEVTLLFSLTDSESSLFKLNPVVWRVTDLRAGHGVIRSEKEAGVPPAVTKSSKTAIPGGSGQNPKPASITPTASGNARPGSDFTACQGPPQGEVRRTDNSVAPNAAICELSLSKALPEFKTFRDSGGGEPGVGAVAPQLAGLDISFGSSWFGRIASQAIYPGFDSLGVRFFFSQGSAENVPGLTGPG